MNKKAKIIIIILLSIIIIGLSYYIVYKKKTDVVIETPVIRKSIKLDDEKEYIYGITNDELSVYENISFPYININSSDARNANSDINEIYKIVMNNLSEDIRSSYSKYYSDNLVSLIYEYSNTNDNKYMTYVFNTENGKLLSLKEVSSILGIKDYKEKINDSISSLINEKYLDYINTNNLNIEEIIDNNINNDYLGYYVEDNTLCVVVNIIIDNSVEIIKIHKEEL